ncbi:unnamed protein product [Prunus brigantina]
MHQFRERERERERERGMEHKQSEVVLFGTWASSFSGRVKIALKLKGIQYEYVEEDLVNKSQMLLSYNPVQKQVPVLVHRGKPIAESRVILEYIDENWSKTPNLLPKDPYERAKIRFWAKYYDEKASKQAIFSIIWSKGKDREKAIEDLSELVKVFEEGMKRDFEEDPPFFIDGSLSFLGIVVSSHACTYEAFHEAVTTVLIPEKNPAFFSWVHGLKGHPLIQETLPPHDKLVARLKHLQA